MAIIKNDSHYCSKFSSFLLYLTALTMIFISCVSTKETMEFSFFNELDDNKNMTITHFSDKHSGANYTMGFFVGKLIHGIITEASKDYIKDLSYACFQAAENVLEQNSLFTFIPCNKIVENNSGNQIIEEFPQHLLKPEDAEDEKEGIKKYIKETGVSGIVTVQYYYTHKSGFKKPVGIMSSWYVYGPDGEQKARIKIVKYSEPLDTFVNTRDSKYKEEFVKLSIESAKEFLLRIQAKEI